MNYLLDTHSLLWFLEGNANLSELAKNQIENPQNLKYVSIATFWEIAIKVSLNKLEMLVPFKALEQLVFENGFEVLPISTESTLTVSQLPFHHRDPFDRILIAQAITEDMTIISKDEAFGLYQVQVIW